MQRPHYILAFFREHKKLWKEYSSDVAISCASVCLRVEILFIDR